MGIRLPILKPLRRSFGGMFRIIVGKCLLFAKHSAWSSKKRSHQTIAPFARWHQSIPGALFQERLHSCHPAIQTSLCKACERAVTCTDRPFPAIKLFKSFKVPFGLLVASLITLFTNMNRALVQSQCYFRFGVGSTDSLLKTGLPFHRLQSHHRARSYVTVYVSSFTAMLAQNYISIQTRRVQRASTFPTMVNSLQYHVLLTVESSRNSWFYSELIKPLHLMSGGAIRLVFDLEVDWLHLSL